MFCLACLKLVFMTLGGLLFYLWLFFYSRIRADRSSTILFFLVVVLAALILAARMVPGSAPQENGGCLFMSCAEER